MSEQQQLVTFFNALAMRKYKENDLSDITYSLLESNPVFRQFFLDFFFPNKLKADEVTIEREHSEDGLRPDFWIRAKDDSVYIVEVKIWDRNHHFEDYLGLLKKNGGETSKVESWKRLGYITNYELNENVNGEGCAPRTWRDFIDKLKEHPCLEDELILGYYKYLEEICPSDNFKLGNWEFSYDDFKKVKAFYDGLENTIKRVDCKLYSRSSRAFRNKQRMGKFFEFTYKGLQQVWGWVGVYYTNEGAELCVEFENRKGWGAPVCKTYEREIAAKNLKLYLTQKNEVASAELFSEENIATFLEGIIKELNEGKLKLKDYHKKNAAHSKALLAIKGLPTFIEETLLGLNSGDTIKDGRRISIIHKKDEVLPSLFCGSYFEVSVPPSKLEGKNQTEQENVIATEKITGWIGVIYTSNYHYTDGDNEPITVDNAPVFVIELRDSRLLNLSGWRSTEWGWQCITLDKESINNKDSLKQAIEGKLKNALNNPSTCSEIIPEQA